MKLGKLGEVGLIKLSKLGEVSYLMLKLALK